MDVIPSIVCLLIRKAKARSGQNERLERAMAGSSRHAGKSAACTLVRAEKLSVRRPSSQASVPRFGGVEVAAPNYCSVAVPSAVIWRGVQRGLVRFAPRGCGG